MDDNGEGCENDDDDDGYPNVNDKNDKTLAVMLMMMVVTVNAMVTANVHLAPCTSELVWKISCTP